MAYNNRGDLVELIGYAELEYADALDDLYDARQYRDRMRRALRMKQKALERYDARHKAAGLKGER